MSIAPMMGSGYLQKSGCESYSGSADRLPDVVSECWYPGPPASAAASVCCLSRGVSPGPHLPPQSSLWAAAETTEPKGRPAGSACPATPSADSASHKNERRGWCFPAAKWILDSVWLYLLTVSIWWWCCRTLTGVSEWLLARARRLVSALASHSSREWRVSWNSCVEGKGRSWQEQSVFVSESARSQLYVGFRARSQPLLCCYTVTQHILPPSIYCI